MTLFEACSAFALAPVCMVAESPEAILRHQGASTYIVTSVNRPGCYQPEATVAAWDSHPLRRRALLPELLARCVTEVGAVRTRLETETALRTLRRLTAAQLPTLPAPLGFRPHRLRTTNRKQAHQHKTGPDPPPALA